MGMIIGITTGVSTEKRQENCDIVEQPGWEVVVLYLKGDMEKRGLGGGWSGDLQRESGVRLYRGGSGDGSGDLGGLGGSGAGLQPTGPALGPGCSLPALLLGPGCSLPALPFWLGFWAEPAAFSTASGGIIQRRRSRHPRNSAPPMSEGKGDGEYGAPPFFLSAERIKSNPASAGFSESVRRATAYRRL